MDTRKYFPKANYFNSVRPFIKVEKVCFWHLCTCTELRQRKVFSVLATSVSARRLTVNIAKDSEAGRKGFRSGKKTKSWKQQTNG